MIPDMTRGLVRLEACLEHPRGAHREVAEALEPRAVRVVQIAHAHAELAGALDHEEAQRPAFEHRRVTAAVGDELERAHRLPIVRHTAVGRGGEPHCLPAHGEGAAVLGERSVIENERVARGAAEAVVAVLEPEEPRECQPAAITRERRDALCAPLADERTLGLRVDGSGCRNGAAAGLQHERE